jgi:nicotinamidase-related amidase
VEHAEPGVADFAPRRRTISRSAHARDRATVHQLAAGKDCLLSRTAYPVKDPIRHKLYRLLHKPTDTVAEQSGRVVRQTEELQLPGQSLPPERRCRDLPERDYFPHSRPDAGPRNNAGFWNLPIPVTVDVDVKPDDIVIYDAEGYEPLKTFLKDSGVRHVLLTGYATDMCFCKTTAGYENLSKDFNVFLVGDATLATFPSNKSPRFAVNAAISFAALNQLVTQVSWVTFAAEGR